MNDILKNIWAKIIGPTEQIELRRIALTTIIFCIITVAALLFCSDILLGLGPKHYGLSSSVTLIFLLLFLGIKKSINLNVIIWTFIVLIFVIIFYVWYMIGGISSVSPLAALAFFAAIPIILDGRSRIFVLLALVAFISILFAIETAHPDLVHMYDTRLKFISDSYVCTIFIGSGIAIGITMIVKSHSHQRSVIESLNFSLTDANKLLAARNEELQKAMKEIKTLKGIIPICSHCKKIRDSKGDWKRLEEYIQMHSDAEFSHGLCQECARKLYPDFGADDD